VTETGHEASSSALGAYGIAWRGIDAAADLLVPVGRGAPAYELSSEVGAAASPHEHVSDDRAELRLRSGGAIVIDRGAGTVRFRVPHPVRPDELVHPYLAPAAAVISRWLGRESMHAGAFVADGRAWGIVGTRESGKSSTLAWLARAGVQILCDDMLIVAEGAVPAGPRSIDLREDAAARIGAGEPIGLTGARERWRLRLGPVAAEPTLAGWIFLAWGERVGAREVGGPERLARLAAERGVRLPPARPGALLEIAALPGWELSRPREWASLPEAAERLLALASATPTAGA
jgi:hypothetical protein